MGAHREAAAQYARALRFARGAVRRRSRRLLERQSDAYYLTDDQLQAIAALEQAIASYRRAGDVRARSARVQRARDLLACRGRLAEAEHAATRAVAMLTRSRTAVSTPRPRTRWRSSPPTTATTTPSWSGGRGPSSWRPASTIPSRASTPRSPLGTTELFRDGIDHSAALERALEQARQRGLTDLVARAMHNLAAGTGAHGAQDARRAVDRRRPRLVRRPRARSLAAGPPLAPRPLGARPRTVVGRGRDSCGDRLRDTRLARAGVSGSARARARARAAR